MQARGTLCPEFSYRDSMSRLGVDSEKVLEYFLSRTAMSGNERKVRNNKLKQPL